MTERDQLQAMVTNADHVLSEIIRPFAQTLRSLWHRITTPEESSFALGCKLVEKQLYKEALWRFRFVLWRRPRHAQAWYNRAVCHFALEETALGVAALKQALAIHPNDETCLFLLATIADGRYAEPDQQPHTTPLALIKSEFAAEAEEYDILQLGEYGYQASLLVAEQLEALCPAGQSRFTHLLDAGCGTGLATEYLTSFAQNITGVDIVPEMLDQARKRTTKQQQPTYHTLIEQDLRTHLLQQQTPCYDAIIMLEVADIIGGLAPVLDGAANALLPGGVMLMSLRLLDGEKGGYGLNIHMRRFEHSSNYLHSLIRRSGLEPLSLSEVAFYEEESRHLAILRKPLATP